MVYSPAAFRKVYDEIAAREDRFEKEFSLRNEIPREFIKKYLAADIEDAGCEIIEITSTPILVDTWEQSSSPQENR